MSSVLLVLMPLVAMVALLGARVALVCARPCRPRSALPSVPRELIRRAVAVVPAGCAPARAAATQLAAADPRVDILIVEDGPGGGQAPARDGACGAPRGGAPRIERVSPRVTVLRPGSAWTREDALQVGAACGLRGGYDAVVTVPLEHVRLARRITPLLDALEDGAHVALGSRYVPGGSVLRCGSARRLVSRGVNGVLRRVTGLPVRDVGARIRAYRREAVAALLTARGRGRVFDIEALVRCRTAGLHLVEVAVADTGPVCATAGLADGIDILNHLMPSRRRPPPDPDLGHVLGDVADLALVPGAP